MTPLELEERLSYLRSLSIAELTAIWKEYDLYGPTGTKDADIEKQWRSRVIVQFIYAIFFKSKLYEADIEKFQPVVGRIFPDMLRF